MGLISSLESCNTQEALSDFLKENTSTWNDDFRRSEFIKTLASKRNLVRNDDDPLVAEKIIELLYRCVEIKDGQELCDIPSVGDLVVQCFKCAKSDTSLSQVGEIVEKMIQYSDGLVEAAAAAASAGGHNNNNNNNSDHKKKSASLYCSVEIAQLLVKSLDQCTSSTSVININNAISSCVVDTAVAKALAVDPLTSSSLLKVLILYSNDSNNNIKILAGAISIVVRIVTTDGNRDDVFSLYSSPAWISSITALLNHCVTTIKNDDDASSRQSVIASNLFTLINIINLKSPQAHSLLASQTVASSMVGALNAHHQSNEKTAKLGVTAIDGIVQKEPSKDYLNGVFANSETITLLVNILNVHTASAAVVLPAVRIMHRIVCAFPNDHQSTLFSSRLTATTLIDTLAKYASNAPVPSIICSVIALSSRDPTTAQNFRLAPNCLSTFTSLLRHHGSTVNDQLGPILYALCYITRCDPARSLFAASKEFLEVFEAASKNATKPMAKSTVLIIVKALAGEYNNNASTSAEEQQQIGATAEPSTTRQEVVESSTTKSNENDEAPNSSGAVTAASTKQEGHSSTATTTPPSPEAAWSAYPPERCFVRGVPKDLSFRESLAALLSIRELPHETLPDGSKIILRPDLEDYIPTDDDVETLTRKADRELVLVKARPAVQGLIKNNDLTDDDIRALLLYKVEQPYPLYLWLNAWLMGQRRDEKIKQTVGPFFTRIHRAMEKLPKIKSRASRSVRINKNIIPQYEERCAAGRPMSFWGFSSFSKNDAVEHKNGEETIDIIYSCPELEGVDMEPFKPEGSLLAMDESKNNNEILPLCPAVFEVVSSTKNDDGSEGRKLVTVIELKQLDHKEFCYVLPK